MPHHLFLRDGDPVRLDNVGYAHHAPLGNDGGGLGSAFNVRRVLSLAYYIDRYTDPVAIASQRRERDRSRWKDVIFRGGGA